MKDLMLNKFIELVRKGEIQTMEIWCAVPGGLVTGKIVPFKTYAKDVAAGLGISEEYKSPSKINPRRLLVKLGRVLGLIKNELIFFQDVRFHAGDTNVNAPFAVIEVNQISAWGLGGPSRK